MLFFRKVHNFYPQRNRLNNMNVNRINKEMVMRSVAKIVADKKMVRSYLKGEVSAQTLSDNGIRLAKPL